MRLPMQTEFRAIVHSEYGAPERVLRIAKRPLKSEDLGVDDALIKVIARPIHHGDIQILSALPQGGPVAPIPEGTERIPGFEGVGTILRLGTNAKAATRLSEGQRVAFFPAAGTCALCAQVCEWCVEQCGVHSHDHCRRCAESCRVCAAECRKIAA